MNGDPNYLIKASKILYFPSSDFDNHLFFRCERRNSSKMGTVSIVENPSPTAVFIDHFIDCKIIFFNKVSFWVHTHFSVYKKLVYIKLVLR